MHESKNDSDTVAGEEGNTEIKQRKMATKKKARLKSGKGPAKKKAAKKKQGPGKKKATKKSSKGVKRPVHADAVIVNAFMHLSAKRMQIQAKCKLSDGTLNTIGIDGLMPHKSANLADIGRARLAK